MILKAVIFNNFIFAAKYVSFAHIICLQYLYSFDLLSDWHSDDRRHKRIRGMMRINVYYK